MKTRLLQSLVLVELVVIVVALLYFTLPTTVRITNVVMVNANEGPTTHLLRIYSWYDAPPIIVGFGKGIMITLQLYNPSNDTVQVDKPTIMTNGFLLGEFFWPLSVAPESSSYGALRVFAPDSGFNGNLTIQITYR